MIKLSVIICTYNRDKYLPDSLQHLGKQSCSPGDFEVVIVDNHSTDSTADICRQFIASNKEKNFFYFREGKQGLSIARNRGIKEARGQYLAFIDDDAFASEDYCRHIISFFDDNPGISVAGGKITPVYEKKEPAWMSRFLWPLVAAIDLGNRTKPFSRSKFPIGANMAFRSSVFKKYGHFNEALGRRGEILEGGEEKDMMHRLRKGREKIYYLPEMHVRHVIPESRVQINYIRRQAIGVGISEVRRIKKLPVSGRIEKILIEAVKTGGTLVLSLYFILTLKPEKGIMLIRFRIWVLKGYLSIN